jgi:hypothetical protein
MRKIFSLAALLIAAPATAHDHYPDECCSGTDCAPVTKVTMVPRAKVANLLFGTSAHASQRDVMMVTTIHGTVPVPENFKRRESMDHRMHACMRVGDGSTMYADETETAPAGVPRLICLFMPPSN